MHYLVLSGGSSPEREVSLHSGTAVERALMTLGHSVTLIDPRTTTTEEVLQFGKKSDGVFPILHGNGGEDGVIQKLLERERIPYFGPSSQSCQETFDKAIFKRILEKHGILTPKWELVTAESFRHSPLAAQPFVLKPVNGGSSIDTFIIRTLPYNDTPLKNALAHYGTMLIEELIEGAEITVGVLDIAPLPVVEIIPPIHEEFDYENKYSGATQELCPPKNISSSLQTKAQEIAQKTHHLTHCRHLSRTDMLINNRDELFVIDTNTIPGLTSESLYPKAAQAAGYSFAQLIEKFTKLL